MTKKESPPNLWQVLISVLGAFFGVQNSRVRERDFISGRVWWVYGLVGIIVLITIILSIIFFAKIIIARYA